MNDVKHIGKVLRVLGNHRRLLILGLLKKGGTMTVGDVATAIKLSFNATSRHLLMLYGVDVLDKEQKGLEVYYKIAPNQPKLVREVLNEL